MPPGHQTDFKVQPIAAQTVTAAVVAQLGDLIRSGQLEQGQRLPSEQRLAMAFGVSRSVIREAMGSLRGVGLVVSRGGSGTYVARDTAVSPTLVGRYRPLELHEVRMHLEIPGAGLAARRATPEQLAALEGVLAQMEHARSDPHHWARLDSAFHRTLADATNNEVQRRLLGDLQDLVTEYSDLANAAEEHRLDQAHQEHRRILDAVVARDPVGAERAMSRHLRNVASLLRRRYGEDQPLKPFRTLERRRVRAEAGATAEEGEGIARNS